MRLALLTTDNREHFKDYSNPQPYFGSAPEALLEGFKMMPADIEVHVVSCLQRKPVSSPAKLGANIHYHALHVPNIGWMKTGYIGCTIAVRRKLREIQPDIVHGQGTERDCAITAVRSGYPNVLTIHGNMRLIADFLKAKPFSYYWLATRLERYCLGNTSGVVAISTYTQNNVARFTRKTWLVHNAVHPSYFAIKRSPPTIPRVLCVAHIGSRKNQIQLIEALDSLAQKRSFQLCFAGGGSDQDPYVRRFLNEVARRSWCSYLGSLARPALQSELSQATCLVLPSLEDNCPMVILEAAAAGIPVAASRVGGVPDLVDHNLDGLLFDPLLQEDIRHSVARLISDHTLADSMASKALESCRKRFAPRPVARQHLQIYHSVI
jgi:glycosyltransferase involved in cell wall biosynthesis